MKTTKKAKKKAFRVRPAVLVALLAVCAAGIFQVACGDDDNAVKETIDSGNPQTPQDSSPGDSATDSGLTDADCYLNPTTHLEIINACTDATRITKDPVLSKLLPDGALPPLQ